MQRKPFNKNWRFQRSDDLWWGFAPDAAGWRDLTLPHDWSIELPRAADNPSGNANGYFPMGRAWYIKTFDAPESWQGKHVFIEFEGVYMNAEVWLNDNFLDFHPYGYTSFACDLTPYLNLGGENRLRVMVNNGGQLNSRWYSGSGITRPVWLMVTAPIHVAHWGIAVTTPEVSADQATVQVQTTLVNNTSTAAEASVRSSIIAADGMVVGSAEVSLDLEPGDALAPGEATAIYKIQVTQPNLWSLEAPYLYWLETVVISDNRISDTASTPFGIRALTFSAEQGFMLNGKSVLLRGGCVHHDNGVLGATAYDRAEERKVEILKANGYNAIRCAHNPPSPTFLDACDRLGMLVIDEAFDCWRIGKNPFDYHIHFDDWWQRDLDSMLKRDRNHPSIIMWSIGNEVYERNGSSGGVAIARMLAKHVRAVDPTRPITSAINAAPKQWPWEQTDAVFAELDVAGYNYNQSQYRPDHERLPERIIYGSEATAGEAFEHWMSVQELPHVIGDFVWTALDYLGESGLGRIYHKEEEAGFLGKYPWHQAYCGDLDLCGFKRPQSYYRDILWERGDPLFIAVHTPVPEGQKDILTYWAWPNVAANWNWPGCEGQTFQVDVYANCDEVELFLNDKSLGKQPATHEQRFIATFQVAYAPGVLRAVAYKDGAPITEHKLHTVGAPAAIRLTPDRSTLKSDSDDLSYITVEIVDAERRVHPTADNTIFFIAQGVGDIVAVGNGNPISTEAYRGNQRSAHQGRCLLVIKAGETSGDIIVRAQADGLDGAEITLHIV